LILVDANVLLYAYDASSERHSVASNAILRAARAMPRTIQSAKVDVVIG
jgi:predicted nucleic acid-binding protein